MKFASDTAIRAVRTPHVHVERRGMIGQVLGAPNRLSQDRDDAETALGAEGWVRPWEPCQQGRPVSAPSLEVQSLRIRMAEELIEARAKRRALIARVVLVAALIAAIGVLVVNGNQATELGGASSQPLGR